VHEDVNLGTGPDTGDGDKVRDAFGKVNDNFGKTSSAILAVQGSQNSAVLNGIVFGVGWAYTGALGFTLTSGELYIDNEKVIVPEQSLSLDAAHATLPRIDVLYVDNTGTFGKITGIPAATPAPSSVDPTTQFYLTFVVVPAAATDLTAGITTETIFNENSEWTSATGGSGFNADSSSNPNSGTKSLELTAVASGAYAKFTRATPVALGESGSLLLWIKSKGTWNAKRSLLLQFYASGSAVGQAVTLKEGSFGFVSSLTTGYQLLVIPKSSFSVPPTTSVNEFRLTGAGSGGSAIGAYIDPIQLQNTGEATGTGNQTQGLTQEQADARYAKKLMPLAVEAIADTAYTLKSTDPTGHKRFTAATAVTLTVPLDLSADYPIGGRTRITAAGLGQVTVAGAGGVTVNSRGNALSSAGQYSVFELERVGTNEWDALGDLTA
jgi:hypothetical protein